MQETGGGASGTVVEGAWGFTLYDRELQKCRGLLGIIYFLGGRGVGCGSRSIWGPREGGGGDVCVSRSVRNADADRGWVLGPREQEYQRQRLLRASTIHGLAGMAAIMASTYKAYLGEGLGPLSWIQKFKIPHPGKVVPSTSIMPAHFAISPSACFPFSGVGGACLVASGCPVSVVAPPSPCP